MKISNRSLTDFTSTVLQKVGLDPPSAETAAGLIVKADLRGLTTHGVAHLGPFYVQRIRDGLINIKPDIKITSNSEACASIDGDNGFGFLVGAAAMGEAIARASKTGAGLVAVRNSTHFGAASVYSTMALEHDMIGITLSSTAPLVFPPGSRSRGAGTNPLSIAVPCGKEIPFVLDMATSTVTGGNIAQALRGGGTIPEGWAVNNEGKPTTVPADVFKGGGGLTPLGGSPENGAYKGFGLGVAVEILCSILSGAVSSLHMEIDPRAPGNKCDHFFGAFRINGFLPVDIFKSKMDEMISAYHSLPKAEEVDSIFVAGEIEGTKAQEYLKEGIPIPEPLLKSLEELAAELEVPFTLDVAGD
jgi:L-2-hydroxycarboxylate dehydrogenase (NAD+)